MKCQCCRHIETSQLICTANQLTGFYMRATLALNGLIICECFKIRFKNSNLISHIFSVKTVIYLLQFNNRNTRTRCKIYSKLTIKTPERRQAIHARYFYLFVFEEALILLLPRKKQKFTFLLFKHPSLNLLLVCSHFSLIVLINFAFI